MFRTNNRGHFAARSSTLNLNLLGILYNSHTKQFHAALKEINQQLCLQALTGSIQVLREGEAEAKDDGLCSNNLPCCCNFLLENHMYNRITMMYDKENE